MPAFSYFDLSLAAVARASDRTESVVEEVRDEVNESVVENDEEKEEPRPRPRVVRYLRRYIVTRVDCLKARERLSFPRVGATHNPEKCGIYYGRARRIDAQTYRAIKNIFISNDRKSCSY